MEYKDFYYACTNLKHFIIEQKKLSDALKFISPSSHFVCEFGDKFVNDYIVLVEKALGDKVNFFSWFVYENEFGRHKFKVKISEKEYKICNEKQFYDVCIKKYNEGSKT